MSSVQWAFEAVALRKKESKMLDTAALTLKDIIVGTMGLNLVRPQDANGTPKLWENMTEQERDGFIPLSMWVGHHEMLKAVQEQFQKEKINIEATKNQSYEALVKSIDEAGGDMEPMLGIDPAKDAADKEAAKAKWEERRKQLEVEKAKSLGIKLASISDVDVVGDV